MTVLAVHVLLFCVCSALAGKVANTCTVYQGGCTYEISLQGRDCMLRDGPANFPSNVLIPPSIPESNIDVKVERKLDELIKEDKQESKKLEDLERKLIKLMEGLSVRSLRHIRHIRNDLRQLSTSMSLLKQQAITTNSNGKKKRGLTCPPEFVGVGTWSSCYRFSNFNTTWHEAREYCNAFGADLVALDSLKESYILDYLIKSNPETASRLAFWTAGNYIVRQRKWMWMMRYELRQMGVLRWAPGEPNARSTMHCLLMYKYADYRWTDAFCKDKHFFICEIELY